jgi:hypothetical protein
MPACDSPDQKQEVDQVAAPSPRRVAARDADEEHDCADQRQQQQRAAQPHGFCSRRM